VRRSDDARASTASAKRDPWPETYDRNTRQLMLFVRLAFVLVGTMPLWLPVLRATLPLGPIGHILDGVFVVMCHRLPARTMELAGVAMPVCSRCAGIFGGLALGIVLAWPRMNLKQARIAMVAAGGLMLADVLAQDFGWHPIWHATRLLTGGLLGYLAAAALVAAIARERVAAAPPP
jgi:uncharacterized membrane protein